MAVNPEPVLAGALAQYERARLDPAQRVRRRSAWLFALVAGLAAWSVAAEPMRVIYPAGESSQDPRDEYPLALLRLVLDQAGREVDLRAGPMRMQQSRSILELERGERLDVMWTVTSAERESRLRAVLFPIDRGLIGWRLLLVPAGKAADFAALDSAAALARRVGLQGHDWPDVAILRSNALQVETSTSYERLFQMLARGEGDYFPRSLGEIWPEVDLHSRLGIEAEPALVLHYPSALYYFVRKDNAELADALRAGLERAQADGSLLRLFDRYFGDAIRRAHLPQRRLIRLGNPDLPVTAPLDRSELWFDPYARPDPS